MGASEDKAAAEKRYKAMRVALERVPALRLGHHRRQSSARGATPGGLSLYHHAPVELSRAYTFVNEIAPAQGSLDCTMTHVYVTVRGPAGIVGKAEEGGWDVSERTQPHEVTCWRVT